MWFTDVYTIAISAALAIVIATGLLSSEVRHESEEQLGLVYETADLTNTTSLFSPPSLGTVINGT